MGASDITGFTIHRSDNGDLKISEITTTAEQLTASQTGGAEGQIYRTQAAARDGLNSLQNQQPPRPKPR